MPTAGALLVIACGAAQLQLASCQGSGGWAGGPPPLPGGAPRAPPPFTVRFTVQLDAGHFESAYVAGNLGGRAAGGRGAGDAPVPAPAPAPGHEGQVFVLNQGGGDSFAIHVHPDWAPVGAARFEEMVTAHFFNDAKFFRVVPGFVVQWGLPAIPTTPANSPFRTIMDDPVVQTNTRGE